MLLDERMSIMMVDDHPLLRKGLRQLIELENELKVVAEASSGVEALTIAAEKNPDLITLDLNMQGMDGLETLRALRHQGVQAKILMLTVSDNNEDVLEAIRSGADGYLLKDMEPDDIIEKIKESVTGKMVISETLTDVLITALRRPEKKDTKILSLLTSREHDIIKLIAKGLSNKLIARELDITDGTVKVHVKHLLKKLALKSRVEAAVWMVNYQAKKSP
ncbi:two-component system response regulator NarL [Shewanella surugensis]|uniref:Two-component system response regulator NarL n=1 Tax=Shewanella surugensis TaxID=212020 RepID=A0ABT0LBP9_9GAMM|nr:two-component system response regulator NarL [Shewanella surugensis]MCL1125083.1 two-component system response regulator NarL [Shewanella surugensis]